ncbi:MAG: hypothetical protein V8T45_11490 [Oscillospiraceae bacterium]
MLQQPYDFQGARIIVREMTDALVLDLVDKGLVTDQIILTVGYEMLRKGSGFDGQMQTDAYGRNIPKAAHGSVNLGCFSSSNRLITGKTLELFDRIVDKKLQVRRRFVVAANAEIGVRRRSAAFSRWTFSGTLRRTVSVGIWTAQLWRGRQKRQQAM